MDGEINTSESIAAEAVEAAARGENDFSLVNLNADLLINILVRLPPAKSVFCSKLVSKGWCSILENPYFVSRFISHHINDKLRNHYSSYAAAYHKYPPLFFISRYNNPRLCFFATGADQEESPKEFTLEFLPRENDINRIVSVKASCNDLLFCLAKNSDYVITHYYICNPFTRQWSVLPPPLIRTTTKRIYFGLVCQPNYQRWIQGQQYESRFRLVRFIEVAKHHVAVDLYCSETGQWNESFLVGAQYDFIFTNVLAHDGKLHWYNGRDVVAYDPFKDGQTIFIDGSQFKGRTPSPDVILNNPGRLILRVVNFRLGECRGLLRFMQIITNSYRSDSNDHLSVWEHKDNETRGFSLVHVISFDNMFSKEACVRDFVKSENRVNARALAFHPENKDVVYLGFLYHIISCNIRTGELEVIDGIPYEHKLCALENVFGIKLPWWPTPVSKSSPFSTTTDSIVN
ncbi:F-box protein [Populus alba x Populus x berolinensis]|nr:F-box protein [Populus alba x Populus x berolinensis]